MTFLKTATQIERQRKIERIGEIIETEYNARPETPLDDLFIYAEDQAMQIFSCTRAKAHDYRIAYCYGKSKIKGSINFLSSSTYKEPKYIDEILHDEPTTETTSK